jgi:hypothetical protein
VCGPSCGHALHTSCLVNLIGFNSTSCPQCRASLVPRQLASLAPALGGGARRSSHAPAFAVPGVEPRSGGRLTAADWEWGASDDSDADGDDAERGHAGGGGPHGRRTSADSALSSDAGGGLVMALRLRAQHVSVLRAICAKGACAAANVCVCAAQNVTPTGTLVLTRAAAFIEPCVQCRWRSSSRLLGLSCFSSSDRACPPQRNTCS